MHTVILGLTMISRTAHWHPVIFGLTMILSAAHWHPVSAGLTMILSATRWHPVSVGLIMISSAAHSASCERRTDDDLKCYPLASCERGADNDLECCQSFILDAYSSFSLVKKIVLTSHLRLQNHG